MRRVHDGMVNLMRALRNDKGFSAAYVSNSKIKHASIKSLCQALDTTNVDNVNKQEICREIRKFLNSQEECLCTPNKLIVPKKATSTRTVTHMSPLASVPFKGTFIDPYGAVHLIQRYLEHCSTGWRVIKSQQAPSCAILQSSGSGKSRLMVEVANTVPTLYLCCRHQKDTGYPPRSPIIVDHLCFNGNRVGSFRAYARCAAFFCVGSLYVRAAWIATKG